jgi:hypothetical protein
MTSLVLGDLILESLTPSVDINITRIEFAAPNKFEN